MQPSQRDADKCAVEESQGKPRAQWLIMATASAICGSTSDGGSEKDALDRRHTESGEADEGG